MPVVGQISVGDGATFTPSVSNSGVISWSNDKNLPNPASVDIAGVVQTAISGVYLPMAGGTVTGNLTVNGTITGNLSGNATTATTATTALSATTATSATNDGNGNEITATYLPLAGGTITGNTTVSADLSVTGDIFSNDINATGTGTLAGLTVSGATSLAGLSTTGNTSVGGDLSTTGNITGATVTTTGSANFADLTVTGTSLLTGDVTAQGDISVTGTTATGDLTATGDSAFNNVAVSGTAALNGTSTAVTPAAEDNSTKIATTAYVQTEIKPIEADVSVNDKRISNIEKLLQGNLYDYQTDTDSKYTKTVPQGAMPYAGLESVGGKTVVWNQLVDSGTSTVTLTSGHKYYTLISSTASIVTGDGSVVSVTGGTDMVCDLTLMFGSGNEPSTLAEFLAIYPNFGNAPYNAGTLLSAGVTEVVSHSLNLLDTTKGIRSEFVVDSDYVVSQVVPTSMPLSWEYSNSTWFVELEAGSYVLSYDVVVPTTYSANGFNVWAEDGGSKKYGRDGNAFTTIGVKNVSEFTVGTRQKIGIQIKLYASKVRFWLSKTSAIPFEKPIIATYPIPAEIQALEGYGWSAGNVYNYVDFENKKFVQNVARVDLGTLTWTKESNHFYSSTNPTAKIPPNNSTPANVVCAKYVNYSASSITSESVIGIALNNSRRFYINDSAYSDAPTLTTALNGVYAFFELTTPIETDISAYLTDDNLIEVESGGSLTFPNANGDDYRINVPSAETYMVDLQSAL